MMQVLVCLVGWFPVLLARFLTLMVLVQEQLAVVWTVQDLLSLSPT